MKRVSYICDCGNIFGLTLVQKGDKIFLQDESGGRQEIAVDNPYEYSPCPEACPECSFCPSDDFIERILNDSLY